MMTDTIDSLLRIITFEAGTLGTRNLCYISAMFSSF